MTIGERLMSDGRWGGPDEESSGYLLMAFPVWHDEGVLPRGRSRGPPQPFAFGEPPL